MAVEDWRAGHGHEHLPETPSHSHPSGVNPAYRIARCGLLSVHRPHVVDHGPDRPRNCPGVPVPRGNHTAGCVAGVLCEPYCDAET